MRRFSIALAAAVATATLMPGPAVALDPALYAQLLERHTREVDDSAGTRVEYAALRESADWRRLVASLSDVEPATLPSDAERKAFWINAYNILAIDLVVQGDPPASIRDLGGFFTPVWKQPAGRVAGAVVTLDQIEHAILRPLGDPRIHAAIVCASLSCPSLLREPWRADTLDAQFERALRRWLADPRKGARIDRANTRLELSRIFEWFPEDFEPAGVLAFVAPYLTDADRLWLAERADRVQVRYLDYDWSLNRLR